MLSRLWSSVVNDPALVAAIGLTVFAIALMLWQVGSAMLEAKRTTITTAAAIAQRRDVHTPERRRWLRRLQRGFSRRAA